MNKYKFGINTAIALLAAILIGVVLGVMLDRRSGARMTSSAGIYQYEYSDKLNYVLDLIESKYVDSVSRDSLAEGILPDLLKQLDPHSVYIPARDFAAKNEPLAGQFDGIGVMFNMLTDTVLITNVISGGPSAKAGVVAGDRIITVNDSIIAGRKMDTDKVVSQLRGKRGTKVTIGVERAGNKELVQIPITRGIIPMKSLDAAFVIKGSVGFIKFSRFAATTYKEIMQAMQQLTKDGATSFIIDVRGNGGGYLDQAIMIANEFLKKGDKIVYTEGLHSPKQEQLADGNGEYKDVPLAILIDEMSASASEILAGAIQDNDRGRIIGRRSFGKGLVQEQIDLGDGSAALITIAHYYTPAGRSIQKPYKKGESEEYFMELYNRAKHSELFNVDSIKQNKDLRYVTPKGKIVYGGGGIMPDDFVPLDTVGVGSFFRRLFEKNLIFKYATKVTEDNRARVNKIQNYAELDNFLAGMNLYYSFIPYATHNGVAPKGSDSARDRSLIEAQLKGYIGRNTPLEEGAFYYYFYPEDIVITKAISVLGK